MGNSVNGRPGNNANVDTWGAPPDGYQGPTRSGSKPVEPAQETPVTAPTYCRRCGHPRTSAPFCEQCGSPNAVTEAQPPNTPTARRGLLIGMAALIAILLVCATVAAVSLLGRGTKSGPSYRSQAAQVLTPVLAENAAITAADGTLSPGASPQEVRSTLATAQSATQAEQQALAALATPKSQASLSLQINSAFKSELAWLQTASTVLANPSSPLLSQLAGLGVQAQMDFEVLNSDLPVAAGTAFPSSSPIVSYASVTAAAAQAASARAASRAQALATQTAAKAQAAAARASAQAQATAAAVQFSSQVLGLLNQSTSSFQAINSFYQQLQTAADGGQASITLAQAEQQITSIVANRTSLAAAAQALNAPTPATQAVGTDLAAAFNASLSDDTDLDNCLNQANNGTDAYIFQSCLSASASASASASSTATVDKQLFMSAFNQLRASIGQPAVSLEF